MSDLRKRALEREAATGDLTAQVALLQARVRLGARSFMPCVAEGCVRGRAWRYGAPSYGPIQAKDSLLLCDDCDGTGRAPLQGGLFVAAVVGDSAARMTANAIEKAQLAQIDVSWPRFADVLTSGRPLQASHVATRTALAAARACLPRFHRNRHVTRVLEERFARMEAFLATWVMPGNWDYTPSGMWRGQQGVPPLGVDVEAVQRDHTVLAALLCDAERMIKEVDFAGISSAAALLREAIRVEVAPWALGLRDPVAERHAKRSGT